MSLRQTLIRASRRDIGSLSEQFGVPSDHAILAECGPNGRESIGYLAIDSPYAQNLVPFGWVSSGSTFQAAPAE